jgi:hypothetical protein
MAHDRWAAGWHAADTIYCAAAERVELLDHEGNKWLLTDTHSGPHGTTKPDRAYWLQRLHDSKGSTVQRGIVGLYLPSLAAVHATLAGKA